MKNQIKVVLLTIFWSLSALGFASPTSLNKFSDLLEALLEGYRVRVVARLEQCSLVYSNPEPKQPSDAWKEVIGGMEIESFNKYSITENGKAKEFIATSLSLLVEHRTLGMVFNRVFFKFINNKDNTIEFESSFIDRSNIHH